MSDSATSSETAYAETDLDEPTNFSLLYAEDDACEKTVDQDVVCTYYTEDTPGNISKATSNWDLRSNISNNDKVINEERKEQTSISIDVSLRSIPQHCDAQITSTYYTEDTPGNISKATSNWDLRSNISSNDKVINEERKEQTSISIDVSLRSIPQHCDAQITSEMKDGKATLFETPLMFSRTSSLDSVSSCPDFLDDHSSIASEFSRVTSGMISPSELPDSPTQIAPPAKSIRAVIFEEELGAIVSDDEQGDSFEGCLCDSTVAFQPIQPKYARSSLGTMSSDSLSPDPASVSAVVPASKGEDKTKDEYVFASDDEDEALLNACIISGMPKTNASSYHILHSMVPSSRKFPSTAQIVPSSHPNIKSSVSLPTLNHLYCEPQGDSVFEDTISSFKDENTPAHFSRASSLSSLSESDSINHQSDQQSNPCYLDNKTQKDFTLTGENKDEKKETLPDRCSGVTSNENLDKNRQYRNTALSPIEFSSPINSTSKELACESEEEEECEDLLKACIISGMPKSSNSSHDFLSHMTSPASDLLSPPASTMPPSSPIVKYASLATGTNLPYSCHRSFSSIGSVFEDSISSFKDENTPVEFSRADSLSSLVSDTGISENDKLDVLSPPRSNLMKEESFTCVSEEEDNLLQACIRSGMPSKSVVTNRNCMVSSLGIYQSSSRTSPASLVNCNTRKEPVFVSEEEDDDDDYYDEEDLLKACIISGMPNSNFSNQNKNGPRRSR